MSRETLRSSDLYVVLMESVAKVGIVVGSCDGMMSIMGEVEGFACYAISQSSFCFGV